MPWEMWLALAIGLPLFAGALYWLIKRQGRIEAERDRALEEAENAYQTRKDANRLEADIRSLPDDKLNDSLRNSAR
jgi:hypothetical protein